MDGKIICTQHGVYLVNPKNVTDMKPLKVTFNGVVVHLIICVDNFTTL